MNESWNCFPYLSGAPRRRADLNNHEFLKTTARSGPEEGTYRALL